MLTLQPSPKGQVCHEVRLAEEQQWSGTGKRGKSRMVSTLNIVIFQTAFLSTQNSHKLYIKWK